MKKTTVAAIFIILAAFSCSKNDPVGGGTTYMNLTAGSSWNYEFINNNPPAPAAPYTVTSTSRDTVIGSRTYHVFSNSTGGAQYFNQSGNDYYSYQPLPAGMGNAIENLYLKTDAAVNQTWMQNFTVNVQGIDVPVTVTNKIQEKGITRTVNNIAYTDVIHVSTSISSILIPGTALTTNIQSYYAPRVGLIENSTLIDLNYMGVTNNTNTQTNLKTAVML
jgi:hypothetical protein